MRVTDARSCNCVKDTSEIWADPKWFRYSLPQWFLGEWCDARAKESNRQAAKRDSYTIKGTIIAVSQW